MNYGWYWVILVLLMTGIMIKFINGSGRVTQLTILKAELLKWEVDLIGFKNMISSQAHIMDSEIRQIEVELYKNFIAKIDKAIKYQKITQVV